MSMKTAHNGPVKHLFAHPHPGPRARIGLLPIALILFALIPVVLSGCSVFEKKDVHDPAKLEARIDQTDSDVAALRQDVEAIKAHTGVKTDGVDAEQPLLTPSRVKILYQQARDRLLKKDFQGAAKGFTDILQGAPRDKLAPNARYWLGECHYSQKRFKAAVAEFERVTQDYPGSEKAPDALLKIAYSYHRLKDGPTAMAHLRTLLKRYPKSRAARLVKNRKTIFKNP